MTTQYATLHFSRFNSSNVTIINDTNPVGQDTTNDQLYAQILCDNTPGSESYGFWQLEGSSIPSDAYNISINNVQARCAVIGINDPNDIETYVQLYEDINTPNGDPSNNPFPMDPQGGNVPIDNPGTWTLSQIRTFYMKVCGNNHGGLTGVEIFVFGVDVEVEYETATPSPDYEIGTGAWYSKIGGYWKEIYKMYYKVGNAWKEVAYAYRKQDNTWYSIGERKLLFEADLTSDLSYRNYLDGTTGNMSWYYGSPSYNNSMLEITTRNDNNFRVYLPLTSSANPQLRAFLMDSTKEHWFTVKTYISSWGSTNYQWVFECGFSTNANSYARDGSIFNMHQVNGPYYTRSDQSGAPYAPAGATIWQKTNLSSDGYLLHYFNATPAWTVSNGNSNTNPGTWYQASRKTNEIYDTTKATWNHSGITGMGWGASSGAGSIVRISDLKIWSSEPTNTEIGI